jgi:hypothetical protein
MSPQLRRFAVLLLLATQAGLLAYSATQHSPTHLEPAFLVSGISHWEFGRYELYRVNPPLVRMIAALPVLAVGYKMDWSRFYDGPGSRAEFPLGDDFIKANGSASIPLFFYARWACIPFNLIGAYFAYRWARELYNCTAAGLVTLTLYVFEPNLLAHGELITPDGACTAFGIMAGYAFWRWLKRPTWLAAGRAGLALGVAELTKMSWLILFGLWPFLWITWRWLDGKVENQETSGKNQREARSGGGNAESAKPAGCAPSVPQLATILLLAIHVINSAYVFDGFGTRLGNFQFVSRLLTGHDKAGTAGNRFRETWASTIPVPLPRQYVLGFDSQKKDLEDFPRKSYLRGEWKDGGWWYYYVYGLLVKVPCGTWGIFLLVALTRLCTRTRPASWRDELVLLLPAVTLLTAVSSQTEFNIHLRYVFPSLGLCLIFLGQFPVLFSNSQPHPQRFLGVGLCLQHLQQNANLWLTNRFSRGILLGGSLMGYSLVSAALVYPHHLAYFNDFVGGPRNGWKHLLGSSFDWGQDLLLIKRWLASRPELAAIYVPNDHLSKIATECLVKNDSVLSRSSQTTVVIMSKSIEKTVGFHPHAEDGEPLGLTHFVFAQPTKSGMHR